ncbi:MAG: hypothetical protein IIB77_11780 [Proteobacteria bacterium]|nr:hypothetical protein [Pseudomonadota bacterium]
MRSKGNVPTAAQKRWRESVRDLGSMISGGNALIHHPVGLSGRHEKQDIGHAWVVPLTQEEHLALHAGELFGYDSRKCAEKHWAWNVFLSLARHPDMPTEAQQVAVLNYHL